MSTFSNAGFAAIMLLPAGLIYAGLVDLTTMRIPNGLIAILCVGFVVAAQLAGVSAQTIGLSIAVALSVLLCSAALFALGLIGGGDAKLAAVAALWLGSDHVVPFLAYTALIGGGLALLVLAFRAFALPARLRARGWIERLHAPTSGIPYGIALGLAALAVFPQTHWATALS